MGNNVIKRIGIIGLVFLLAISMVNGVAAEDFRDKPDLDFWISDGYDEDNEVWSYDSQENYIENIESAGTGAGSMVEFDEREYTNTNIWVKISIESDDSGGILLRDTDRSSNDRSYIQIIDGSDEFLLSGWNGSDINEVRSVNISPNTAYWIHQYYDDATGETVYTLHHSNSDGLPSSEIANISYNTGLSDTRYHVGVSTSDKIYEYWWTNIAPSISGFDYPRNVGVGEDVSISYNYNDYEGDSVSPEIVLGDKIYQSSSITDNRSKAGVYETYAEVSDAHASRRTDTHYVTVLSSSNEPIAFFDINQTSPAPNESISLDASGSGDLEGISSYEWQLGDGRTKSGEQITVNYNNTSTYNIVLEVSDADGNTDSISKTVTVQKQSGGTGIVFDNQQTIVFILILVGILTLLNYLEIGGRSR